MNTSTARQEYATLIKFCTLCIFRTTHRLRTDVLSFVGCQNSTNNFKLASLGMWGAQERALLVSDENIGTYGSCTRILMKTTLLVVLNKYRLVYNNIFFKQYVVYKSTALNKYRLLYTTNVPVYGI